MLAGKLRQGFLGLLAALGCPSTTVTEVSLSWQSSLRGPASSQPLMTFLELSLLPTVGAMKKQSFVMEDRGTGTYLHLPALRRKLFPTAEWPGPAVPTSTLKLTTKCLVALEDLAGS